MKTACKLRSFEAYNDFHFADFDSDRMEISHASDIINSNIHPSGFCYSNGDQISGFFFVENCWYFFVGRKVSKTSAISKLIRHYSGAGDAYVEILLNDGNSLTAHYSLGGKIAGDPTPFVEDEDFDFGLFFENVVLNEDRWRRMADFQNT